MKNKKQKTSPSKDQYIIHVSMKVNPLNTLFVMLLKRFLSGIEDKSHFEFIECNTLDCDENTYSMISDRNLTYAMIDNEITNGL